MPTFPDPRTSAPTHGARVRPRARRLAAGLGLVASAFGCGGATEPAELGDHRPLVGRLTALGASGDADFLLLPDDAPTASEQGLELELTLPPGAWRAVDIDDAWFTPLPVPVWEDEDAATLGLEVDGAVLERTDLRPQDLAGSDVQASIFGTYEGLLFLLHGTEPERTRLVHRVPADFGGSDPGRLRLPGVGGRGCLFGSGLAWSTEADVRPGDRLHLGLALGGLPEATVRVELRVDGEPVAERELRLTPDLDAEPWTVPLEAAGRRRLELRATGDPSLGALLDPRLAPAPADAATGRPNVVLFLADTLRADALAAYRDPATGYVLQPDRVPAGLTPALDALGQRSRLYREAWSSSTWTLPAHGSLFSSLHPRQHTATLATRRLPAAAETLAERLGAAGYRTVAVTEGGFCSARFGLDQGFDVFEEGDEDLARTLELARRQLEVDDGRPVFLFVQTFRVHGPFRAETATLQALDLDVEPRLTANEIAKSLADDIEPGESRSLWIERYPAELRRLEALYHGGAREFDTAFGAWFEGLETAGWFERGLFALTSDHGNAFGENERLFHSSEVFEAQLRIPLFLFGGGVEPGLDTTPAGLVDLAPTLATWAGAAPPPAWVGEDLLAPDRAGVQWASSDVAFHDVPSVARLADGWKWMRFAPDAAPVWFELSAGPEVAADPPADLESPAPDRLADVLRPRAEIETFRRTRDMDDQLRRLGYLEDEDTE